MSYYDPIDGGVKRFESSDGRMPVKVGFDRKTSVFPHRSGVTAVDKLATLAAVTLAADAGTAAVLAAATHGCIVVPGNRYGIAGAGASLATITPTLNKAVNVTIPPVSGAEWYDIYFSASGTAPAWLGRITEAQRAAGCALTAVATVGAGGTPGVKQVETATAAGTITLAGNASVVVTAAGMTGSPKTIAVAVALNDDATAWATKVRAALAADVSVAAMFDVSGATSAIILTSKTYSANDGTLNIALDNGTCTGITTAASSANTTAGVQGGIISLRLVGTGMAGNDASLAINNGYRPATVTKLNCIGRKTAYIHVKTTVTDLRGLPTLSIIPFLENSITGDFYAKPVTAVNLLTALGKPMYQVVAVDVESASGLVVLVDAITGQGTSVDIWVELV